MINIKYIEIDPSDKARLEKNIPKWHKEVRLILPGVPKNMEYIFDMRYLAPDTGAGGYTLSKEKIALAFDSSFEDKMSQMTSIRGAVFHENYHVVQGWTGEIKGEPTAMFNTIMEGAATVFERDTAGASPPWAVYDIFDNPNEYVKKINQLEKGYDWRRWKFEDPETSIKWIMYRIGTYIVDQALENNKELSIVDLATLGPEAILELSKTL